MSSKTRTLIGLHALLLLYSVSGIMSKLAAGYEFPSTGFIVCYGGVLVVLGLYALGWQQVIKRLPLTTAYANRAVCVIWGIVWGVLLFSEPLNAYKLIGAVVVLVGVVLFATAPDDVKPDGAASDTPRMAASDTPGTGTSGTPSSGASSKAARQGGDAA